MVLIVQLLMKVLLIEDEALAANHLVDLLQKLDESIEVVDVLESVEDSVDFLQTNPKLDLIFSDIHLADGLAFSIFKEVEVQVPIVFTTAYNQYALDAFQLNSIDYLLKPIEIPNLERALQKFQKLYASQTESPSLKPADFESLLQQIQQKTKAYKSRFLIKIGKKLIPITTHEINHFVAKDKLVLLVNNDQREFPVDYILDELESLLNPDEFHRVNRSFIVNIQSIQEVVTLPKSKLKVALNIPTDQEIVVSYAKSHELKKWLKQ